MTTILALDTSAAVSVGVVVDGQIVASGRVDDTRARRELMPLVQRTLAGLDTPSRASSASSSASARGRSPVCGWPS